MRFATAVTLMFYLIFGAPFVIALFYKKLRTSKIFITASSLLLPLGLTLEFYVSYGGSAPFIIWGIAYLVMIIQSKPPQGADGYDLLVYSDKYISSVTYIYILYLGIVGYCICVAITAVATGAALSMLGFGLMGAAVIYVLLTMLFIGAIYIIPLILQNKAATAMKKYDDYGKTAVACRIGSFFPVANYITSQYAKNKIRKQFFKSVKTDFFISVLCVAVAVMLGVGLNSFHYDVWKSDLEYKFHDEQYTVSDFWAGNTPRGHWEIVDERNLPPILFAAKYNDMDKLKKALAEGGDPNVISIPESEEKTVLEWACEHNNYEMAKLLLEHGANVNPSYEDWHESPLAIAVSNKDINIELVELLVEYGADRDKISWIMYSNNHIEATPWAFYNEYSRYDDYYPEYARTEEFKKRMRRLIYSSVECEE